MVWPGSPSRGVAPLVTIIGLYPNTAAISGLGSRHIERMRRAEEALSLPMFRDTLRQAAPWSIRRKSGQPENAALFVEQLANAPYVAAEMCQQTESYGRIEVPAAGTHHETLQRGVSHGVVHRTTIDDSAQTGSSAAEMARNGRELFQRLCQA